MIEELDSCQNSFRDLTQISSTIPGTHVPLGGYWCKLRTVVFFMGILGLRGFTWVFQRLSLTILVKLAPKHRALESRFHSDIGDLNLQVGELVEVKPLGEILATLDVHMKLKGLGFVPEMAEFCGRRFRVYKRLTKILVETTGELRKMRMPTVLLEGVFCDGRYHGGCDRSCFCFWREAWLKKT